LAPIPRSLLVLLLVCAFTLGMGLALKDSCNGPSWDGYQYRALCYNDIVPLYYAHGFEDDLFPYVDHPERDADRPKGNYDPAKPDTHWGFVEYPVLTGLHMFFAAKLGSVWSRATGMPENGQTFLYTNAAMLSAFALASVVLLWRMVPDPRRVALFAAGTPVVLYAFHNWDLMAVFFLILTLYWFERGRFGASGLALSFGASAKLFPIVVAPLLFVVLWRAQYDAPASLARVPAALWRALLRARNAWLLFVGTVVGFAVVNLPFLLWGSPSIYFEVFRFHLRRTPNFETIWWVAHEWGNRWGFEWMSRLDQRPHLDRLLLAAFVLCFVAVAALAWVRRWGPRTAAFAAVLVFLLLNKIFSVQYALWILPFFALLPLPIWTFAVFAAADAWVYSTIFAFFGASGTPRQDDSIRWLSWAVVTRTLSLLTLLAWLVAKVRRPLKGGSPTGLPPVTHVAGEPAPRPEAH